uniref:Uncharacterized protein n=1 Tax=Ananas comosus var. bracteatus TaxID=296719 RepID=A0A6V7PMW1_ANACO|nr:unnamed protein product [Ananas comosus var. bracteatus]
MGSMDDHLRKPTHTRNCTTRSNLKIVLLLVSTNLVSIFFFSGVGSSALRAKWWGGYAPSIHLWDSEALLRELNATKFELSKYQSESFELHKRLGVANSLLQTLLSDMGRTQSAQLAQWADGWAREPTGELKLAVGPHKLPLGYTANLGADELYPTLGTACRRFQDELEQYMRYDVGGECPSDDVFAQRLMLKGCEPLPRRRCHPKTARGYVEPVPFPASLWTIPPDTSIVWDAYTCKNYSCLVNRNKEKGTYDCKDCFDLAGREKDRWLHEIGELDYSIDGVLSYKSPGTVRIGLDIGAGPRRGRRGCGSAT